MSQDVRRPLPDRRNPHDRAGHPGITSRAHFVAGQRLRHDPPGVAILARAPIACHGRRTRWSPPIPSSRRSLSTAAATSGQYSAWCEYTEISHRDADCSPRSQARTLPRGGTKGTTASREVEPVWGMPAEGTSDSNSTKQVKTCRSRVHRKSSTPLSPAAKRWPRSGGEVFCGLLLLEPRHCW